MTLKAAPLLCLLLAIPGGPVVAQDQQPLTGDDTIEMQKHFAEAYNRGDVDAMAAAFTGNAVRVTPSGIFQGRDAIRGSFQEAMKLGLHDYSVERTLSRSEAGFVFNAGKWKAKVGDQTYHGYYTSIIVRQRGEPKIREETVTIAAPRSK